MNNILVSSLGFLCLIYPRLAVEHAGKQKIPSCWPKSRIATKDALSKESRRLAKQGRKHWASVKTLQPDITEQNCGLALPIPAKSISGALYLPLLDSAIVKAVVWWYQRRAKRVPSLYHYKLVMSLHFPMLSVETMRNHRVYLPWC